jgi:hypothetical protein
VLVGSVSEWLVTAATVVFTLEVLVLPVVVDPVVTVVVADRVEWERGGVGVGSGVHTCPCTSAQVMMKRKMSIVLSFFSY